MNSINIYQELLGMMDRENIKPVDISIATGVSRTAVSKWFKLGKVNDKYIWLIANGFNDDRFLLAVLCYSKDLPVITLNILNKYQKSPLAMLVGTQLEDLDSDSAIKNLLSEISKKEPDIKIVTSCLKEIQETSNLMGATVDTVAESFGISMRDVVLERD